MPPPDTTPLGRIVNRFSGDLTTVDTAVAGVFSGTLLMFAQTVFNLGNIIAIFYYMAIPLVPLAIAYYKIQDFFRKSSVELQRLTSISKSPVLATFGEVLSGLATIRAYQVRCAPHFLVERQSRLRVSLFRSFFSFFLFCCSFHVFFLCICPALCVFDSFKLTFCCCDAALCM